MSKIFKYNEKKFDTQKELFSFLCDNEKDIITQKKAIKFTDPFSFKPTFSKVTEDKLSTVKSKMTIDGEEIAEVKDIDIVNVIVVGNTMNFIDSQDDALMNDSCKKTIAEGQKKIKHLADHNQNTRGKIGIPNSFYLETKAIRDLGFDADGLTQVLIMDSNVLKCYDKKLFYQYLNNDIDQHSIGLVYVSLFLCVNDSENADKFKNWNNYFPNLINKDVATENGYFFAVTEVKLLEVSAVLWGSNELTPVLSTTPIVELDDDIEKQAAKTLVIDIKEEPITLVTQKRKKFIN